MSIISVPYTDLIVKDKCPSHFISHKFGRCKAVGTSYAPVSIGSIYRTPQVANATKLRIAAGNVNDSSSGSGAREITLLGIDTSGEEITETLATNGTSASSSTVQTFLRLQRAFVSKSGTYGTATAGSHAANIVIENSSGGTTWATIDATKFPKSQTEIGAYTVPLYHEAYIRYIELTTASNKEATVALFIRENILETAAPYTALKANIVLGPIIGTVTHSPMIPMGPFKALTDLIFMATVPQTMAEVQVNIELEIIRE